MMIRLMGIECATEDANDTWLAFVAVVQDSFVLEDIEARTLLQGKR